MKSGRYIGVMSGTSLDGVDVVLAAIDEHIVAQQASYCHPMPLEIRQKVLDVCQGQPVTLSQLGRLDTHLGRLFSEAIETLMQRESLSAEDIVGIGCHGQTVWHEPEGEAPFSMQLGDNNQIVARTGITVVGDFRRRDMAMGGQAHRWCLLFTVLCLCIRWSGALCLILAVLQMFPCCFLARISGVRHRAWQYPDGCLDLATT